MAEQLTAEQEAVQAYVAFREWVAEQPYLDKLHADTRSWMAGAEWATKRAQALAEAENEKLRKALRQIEGLARFNPATYFPNGILETARIALAIHYTEVSE